ncbi:unnamed protein product [Caenorhabditis brenneri]
MDANKNSAPLPIFGRIRIMINCLQITHGVRLQLTAQEYEETIIYASYFGFFNTIKYCEQRMIEMNERPKLEARKFQFAIRYNMRRYLVNIGYIRFETENIDDTTFVYPFISSDDREDQVQVRAYFNIIKKDGSSSFQTDSEHLYLNSNEACIGEYMDVEEVLDEGNGYLDEGTLTVEYGFHVESVVEDGIWKFNFFNPLFDSKNLDNMFTFCCPRLTPMCCHKLLTKLHSNAFSDCDRRCQRFKSSIVRSRDLAACLQIAHGVRIQSFAINFQNVIRVAFQLGLFNTVRYCERQLIEMDWQMVSTAEKFEWAVKYNMRCLLIDLLKNIKSTKQLIAFLSRLNLEEMTSESLKAIVDKLFS